MGQRAHFLFLDAEVFRLGQVSLAQSDTIQMLCQPVVEGLGFILWGVEYLAQGKHSVLRIYIDHAEGISVDDCAEVSAQVAAVLDVEDPIQAAYTLEVSSPGMARPLFVLAHYVEFKGAVVQIKLRRPYQGQRRLRGIIQGVEQDDVVVLVEDEEWLLPIEQIEKANILPDYTVIGDGGTS